MFCLLVVLIYLSLRGQKTQGKGQPKYCSKFYCKFHLVFLSRRKLGNSAQHLAILSFDFAIFRKSCQTESCQTVCFLNRPPGKCGFEENYAVSVSYNFQNQSRPLILAFFQILAIR